MKPRVAVLEGWCLAVFSIIFLQNRFKPIVNYAILALLIQKLPPSLRPF